MLKHFTTPNRKGGSLVTLCLLVAIVFGGHGLASATPSDTTDVSIVLDTKSPSAVIHANFAGLSFEAAQLLPDTNGIHYFRPDNAPLVRMFRTLGIRSLRIGGNTSDRDARELPGPADWDDFFAFTRAAGVKVIYGLRLYHADPSADAQTAKYLMDHYASQLEAFAIGQEPTAYPVIHADDSSVDQHTVSGAGHFSYSTYARQWRRFADEIVAQAPGVKFCGPSVHNNGPWTCDFITNFAGLKNLALITEHLYAGGAGDKVPSPEIGRDEMLSGRFAQTCQKLYDGFVPCATSNGLPYRLEEVNSFYNGGAAGVSDTFAAALWGLDFMYWWAERGATGLNFHTGDQVAAGPVLRPAWYAVFRSVAGGYDACPLAYGLKAFSLGARGRIIPVTIVNPQTINLTAYATLDEERSVCVTLINREHGEHAQPATVSLRSTGGSFRAGQIIYLKSTAAGVAATSGETLGGAEISTTGDFAGKWTPLPALENAAANIWKIELPEASAAVIKFTFDSQANMSASR